MPHPHRGNVSHVNLAVFELTNAAKRQDSSNDPNCFQSSNTSAWGSEGVEMHQLGQL